MQETSREDIRRLLRTFGIQADEAITSHLARKPGQDSVGIRLLLEEVTAEGQATDGPPLHLEVTGEIRR